MTDFVTATVYDPQTSVSRGAARGADDGNYEEGNEPGAWLRCHGDSEDGGARGAGGLARRATGRACILNYPQDYRGTWDHR